MAASSPSATERCHGHGSHRSGREEQGFCNRNTAPTTLSGVVLTVTPHLNTGAVSTLRDTAHSGFVRRHAYEVAASQSRSRVHVTRRRSGRFERRPLAKRRSRYMERCLLSVSLLQLRGAAFD